MNYKFLCVLWYPSLKSQACKIRLRFFLSNEHRSTEALSNYQLLFTVHCLLLTDKYLPLNTSVAGPVI